MGLLQVQLAEDDGLTSDRRCKASIPQPRAGQMQACLVDADS